MRLALSAIASLGLMAACSSFGEGEIDTPETTGDASPDPSATHDATAAEAAVFDASTEGAAADGQVATGFCPVPGAAFCSDFELGALPAGWSPGPAPTKFLTRVKEGSGHVLRATLTSGDVRPGARETVEKDLGSPGTVRYALDVRVDQKGDNQSVEVASVRTSDPATTLAFHILVEGTDFGYAEFASAGNPKYGYTKLIPIDSNWHRFDVEVTYASPIKVKVRVDGVVRVDRDSEVKVATVPPGPRVLAVGVNSIGSVGGSLGYVIDNVTAFLP